MIANMNKYNGKRLVAMFAIFTMVACCLVCVVPTADAASTEGTYANGTTQGYVAVSDVASVSFIKSDGSEWVYEKGNGNTEDITNSKLGNTGLQMTVNGTTVNLTGTLKFQGADSQLKLTGAPAGYNYAFIFDLADVNDNGDYNFGADGEPIYIAYVNSMNVWKPLTKEGDTSTQLVYVNEDRRSTTYYISSVEMENKTAADAAVAAGKAKTLTVNWDFNLDDTINADDSALVEAINNGFEGGAQEITVTSDQTLSGTITLTEEGQTLNVDGAKINSGTIFEVANGATVNYTIVADKNGDGATFTFKGGNDANGIKISDAIGSFTITGGSAEFEGIINGSMTIGPAGDGNNDGNVVFKDAIIPANVTITLEDGVGYSVSGSLTVYGKIVSADGNEGAVEIEVDGENSIKAYPGASFGEGIKIVGDGKIDISAALSTVTLNDDIETSVTWSQSQRIVIADTLTIKEGRTMTVLGELVINEGCTVIIENGASLVVGSGTDNIKATGVTINGNIDVEANGTFKVDNAEDVTVVGAVTSNGTVTINSNVTVKNGGSIIIEDYENAKGEQTSQINVNTDAKFIIEKGGELSVSGKMSILSISNAGTVTLDGAVVDGNTEMDLTADGAVADIKSMTFGNTGIHLYIRDVGMYLFTDDDDEDVTIVMGEHNAVAIDAKDTQVGIRNLTVTASLTSEKVDKNTTGYHNSLIVSGSPSVYDDKDDGEFNGCMTIVTKSNNSNGKTHTGYTTESSIEVPGSLTLGKNIVLSQDAGDMNVDGTITATTVTDAKDAVPVIRTNGGQIYVNGMITIDQDNGEIKSEINSFFYEDDDNYYYTTLKTSVDNAAEDIEYLGNVTVLDTLTIPAGTELSKGKTGMMITIGDEDNRDVVVTIADGATVKNCTIDVMATLVFEDNKNDNRTTNRISSDVIIDETPKRTYTNIYTALDDAADNSTVTIARNIFLDKDAEIRETITLAIPASYGVYLDNEVTLTVNGTIQNSGKIDAAVEGASNQPITDGMAGFNPYTDAANTVVNEKRSEIVVNGTIMSMNEMKYDKYYIPGAYYQMVNDAGAWYYITPVDQAAAVSDDVQKGAIAIYGENTVGDIAFTGDKTLRVTVTVYGDLEAGTVTLNLATLAVEGSFDGTVGSAVGTIDAVNATGFTVVDTLVGADDVQTLYLTGKPVAADKELDASVTVATGTVNAGQIQIDAPAAESKTAFDFVIASGATLMVAGDYDNSDAKFTSDEMTVDGTLVANDGGFVDVDTLTVRGTFTVMAADDETKTDAGKADITTLYVGIAKDDKTGKFVDASAAAVNAKSLGSGFANAYVSGESTITADLVAKMNSTEFYVEDTLWLTVYTINKTMDVNTIAPGDLVNSEFSHWIDSDGEIIGKENPVNVGQEEKVYAVINYNIYTVTVFADPGITAVYIDGKLMTSGVFRNEVNGMWAEGFQLTIAAGTHEITYKLGNYFSGEAKMTVDGTAVDGNKFTTSGTTSADKSVEIYLQGIEASAPETPAGSSDDGMGLTDYLLIILVVLIVIMAIMVAMRLMRS